MNNQQFRKLINLFEERDPSIAYQDSDKGDKVVALLQSYNSQVYTKLAQKIQRMTQLEAEVKQLKEEVKQAARENVADLFDAEDIVRTRVVETISFVFVLSKDPKETVTPKYKEILSELEAHLTPELIKVLEELKKQMVTVTQKQPSLSVSPISEGIVGNIFAKLKNLVMGWAQRYDQKLDQLKMQAGVA